MMHMQLLHGGVICALQHSAPHCNTLQHTATHCNTHMCGLQHSASHCNTLQHTAPHICVDCNIVHHTAKHCSLSFSLSLSFSHCRSLAYLSNGAEPWLRVRSTFVGTTSPPQHTATHGNTRQQPATHYNTLAHTPTIRNKLEGGTPSLQYIATHSRSLTYVSNGAHPVDVHKSHMRSNHIPTTTPCNTLQHTIAPTFPTVQNPWLRIRSTFAGTTPPPPFTARSAPNSEKSALW